MKRRGTSALVLDRIDWLRVNDAPRFGLLIGTLTVLFEAGQAEASRRGPKRRRS